MKGGNLIMGNRGFLVNFLPPNLTEGEVNMGKLNDKIVVVTGSVSAIPDMIQSDRQRFAKLSPKAQRESSFPTSTTNWARRSPRA
jgi:hypothetical protein